jgi:hypothetical protein
MRQMLRHPLILLLILFVLLGGGCVGNNITQPTGEIAEAEIHVVHPAAGGIIEVKFYLETLKFQKKSKYAEVSTPGAKPFLQFINSELSVLSMTLFFDSSEAGTDVRELTNKVLSLIDVDQTINAPPILSFRWKGVEFECVLESAVQEFLKLFPDGRPSRAKIDVIFKEFVTLSGN